MRAFLRPYGKLLKDVPRKTLRPFAAYGPRKFGAGTVADRQLRSMWPIFLNALPHPEKPHKKIVAQEHVQNMT
jgi:hypothetical protein